MHCKKCESDKSLDQFYAADKTCKECRKEMVRANREAKADYYRQYDKDRFKNDPKVKDRHAKYAASEEGKIAKARAIKGYQERWPMKRAAHVIVGNAVRDGSLVRPQAYESCGSDKKIEAHHDDYTKPLIVRWLCEVCHKEWHRNNEPIYS